MTRRPAEAFHPGEYLADELAERQDQWTISYALLLLALFTVLAVWECIEQRRFGRRLEWAREVR